MNNLRTKREIEASWMNARRDFAGYEIVSTLQYAHSPTTCMTIPGSTGPIISNTTDFVPILLFAPTNHHSMIFTREFLDKPFSVRMRSDTDIDSSRRLRVLTQRHLSNRIGYPGNFICRRTRSNLLIDIGFLTIIPYGTVRNFACAAVVPQASSLDFQEAFLNMREIYPSDFGIEFWFCPEIISRIPVLRTASRMTIPYQLERFGLIGHSKTPHEMSQLFTKPKIQGEKYSTLIKKKIAGQETVREAMNKLV